MNSVRIAYVEQHARTTNRETRGSLYARHPRLELHHPRLSKNWAVCFDLQKARSFGHIAADSRPVFCDTMGCSPWEVDVLPGFSNCRQKIGTQMGSSALLVKRESGGEWFFKCPVTTCRGEIARPQLATRDSCIRSPPPTREAQLARRTDFYPRTEYGQGQHSSTDGTSETTILGAHLTGTVYTSTLNSRPCMLFRRHTSRGVESSADKW